MELKNWNFYYGDLEPLSCQAPCTMYSVLLDHQKIPDPFYGRNDRELTKYAEQDCTFVSEFEVGEEILNRDFAELTFYGLDTICAISLNGKPLDSVQNMHRTYTYSVKDRLIPGKNILKLEFSSPTRYFAQRHRRHYLYTNDGDTIPGAAHLRKALYMSGWDWGPALPDMGIWRPVELRAYDTDRIREVEVRHVHHDGVVDVLISANTRQESSCTLYASMDGKRVRLENGRAVIRIEDPQLWWVRGYGRQPLYGLDVELMDGDTVIDWHHSKSRWYDYPDRRSRNVSKIPRFHADLE